MFRSSISKRKHSRWWPGPPFEVESLLEMQNCHDVSDGKEKVSLPYGLTLIPAVLLSKCDKMHPVIWDSNRGRGKERS